MSHVASSVPSRRNAITMLGTSIDAQGGIAAVISSFASSEMSNLYTLDYVKTHVDGTATQKLLVAVAAWVGLLVKLLSGKIDLLHVHVASRASFWRKCILLLPAHMLRRKILWHLHGGEFKIFYERECSALGRRVIRYLFESTAGVVVLSNSWREWIKISFPRAKVHVIYNPAPTIALAPGDQRDSRSLLFLGRLGEGKGTGDLLRAVARIPAEIGEVKVFLGGDGEVSAMKQLARELGIEMSVVFLGWVDGLCKSTLLQQCSVFVLPSYNEGLPMGLLEAMGQGMPVVTTPVGGIPEAVTDGVEGFLVKPGDLDALADRLVRLLRDPTLHKAMGTAGAQKVAEVFAMDRILPQWVALYSELGLTPAPDVSMVAR